MNIFYLHKDPEEAVKPMYNKHVVKMILETAQLLCTAHHINGNGENVPYKKTHVNHPSTVWVRENTANYNWAYCHFIALCDEYTKRYGKTHLTFIKCSDVLFNPPSGMKHSNNISEMPQCMPDEYKVVGDPIKGYRNYYLGEKHSVANKDEKILKKLFGYSI
jgi:hypothetical protein